MSFSVFKSTCKNCLLYKDRIVSPQAAKQIINSCLEQNTFFVCHRARIDGGKSICCSKFYDKFSDKIPMINFMKKYNLVRFVEQVDSEKLPTHNEMTK